MLVPSTSWDVVFSNTASRHFGGRLSQPMAGAWKLEVTNLGKVRCPRVPYQVIVSGLSNLTVDLLLPDRLGRRFTTGERIPIYALLSSKAPIAGADVKASITAPNTSSPRSRCSTTGSTMTGPPMTACTPTFTPV